MKNAFFFWTASTNSLLAKITYSNVLKSTSFCSSWKLELFERSQALKPLLAFNLYHRGKSCHFLAMNFLFQIDRCYISITNHLCALQTTTEGNKICRDPDFELRGLRSTMYKTCTMWTKEISAICFLSKEPWKHGGWKD